MNENVKIYIIDSSAIFSGKPLIFNDGRMVTSDAIQNEFSPGGRDYLNFQLLKEKGLQILAPSSKYIKEIKKIIIQFGEEKRLSIPDISLLAIAFEIKETFNEKPVIVSDDYSIQNIASQLNIEVLSINAKGITKRFKWSRRCRGCGKQVKEDVDVCPICGSSVKNVVIGKKPVKK